jgi:subtilase family serine protease
MQAADARRSRFREANSGFKKEWGHETFPGGLLNCLRCSTVACLSFVGRGGGTSQCEPIPSWQGAIKKIVENKRGYPEVASAAQPHICHIYRGVRRAGAGASWPSPTLAGIVNAAGHQRKSSNDELTAISKECTNKKEYKADFDDIPSGDPNCIVAGDFCASAGSPRTYAGK